MAAVVLSKPVVIAGITLEATELSYALQALAMTRAELEQVMAPSSAWPFPASLDGWKLSHDAIRYDMDAILAAIEKTVSLVVGGRPLEDWQVRALRLVVREFHRNVHQHHDHEEDIFFPWMETRVRLPPKLSSDHRTLMTLMDRARDLCDQMKPQQAGPDCQASLEDLHRTFVQLRGLMRQHLEEEEIIGLPLLRKHFTAKEAAVTEKKIIADTKPGDVAWFVRPMDLAQKKETMTHLQIPGLVQTFVMLPAVRRDERTVVHAYRELAEGERIQEEGQRKTMRMFFFAS